jgi:PPOX class F420-dependent enzyme/OxyR family protein/uncharacterized protein (TIGR02246 family)
VLDEVHVRYLNEQSRGRLSTVAPDGSPQNKPVGYHYNSDLGTIDIAGLDLERSAKYRNIAVNPMVAFVVDDAIGQGAENMRFLEVRGHAEQVSPDQPGGDAGLGSHLIRIHPHRLVSWNVDPDLPGMHTQDVPIDGVRNDSEVGRPVLDLGGAAAKDAADAVGALVGELQAGWDDHDAETSNRHFAANVVWGSPFGATVYGYDDLHAIHIRLKEQGRGGPSSRYEIEKVTAPAPGVAIAQVRRVALDSDGQPIEVTGDTSGSFSEMALYVLVRRSGTWWLAAGQNTPVRPPPST